MTFITLKGKTNRLYIDAEQLDPESSSKVSFKTFRLDFRRYNEYRTKWFLNRCSTGGETIVYVDAKS